MSERFESLIPDFGDYSPEGAAGYSPSPAPVPPPKEKAPAPQPPEEPAGAAPAESENNPPARETAAPASTAESIAERSRRAVMSQLGQTLRKHRQDSAAQTPPPQQEKPHSPPVISAERAEELFTGGLTEPKHPEEPRKRPRVIRGEDGIITLIYGDGEPPSPEPPADEHVPGDEEAYPAEPAGDETPEEEPMPLPAPETAPEALPEAEDETADEAEDEYEPEEGPEPSEAEEAGDEDTPGADRAPAPPTRTKRRPRRRTRVSFREKLLSPAVRFIATRLARREQQRDEAANWPEPEDIRETPELQPKQAAKYYSALARTLRLRCRVALLLTVTLAWIALGLPMAGMLGYSLRVQAGVSLILTLAVMLTALDVVSCGFRQLLDLRPGPEALAVLSALLSCVDGALVLAGFGDALPFCAVGAAALTFGLWGSRLTCLARMRTFRAASATRSPYRLSSDASGEGGKRRLMRSDDIDIEGIVRRSESQDLCRTTYATAAPILLAASFLLSIAASAGGQGGYFLHTFSALTSVGTSFAAFFSFPLSYAIASRRLRDSGVALAGYAGVADIGKTRSVVITDEDLFPPGTVKFREISALEGVFLGKVVSATASLIFESGSGISSLFEELVERRGYHVPEPSDFTLHESGGLSGIVAGERVHVGPARFMNLEGIRLPQNLTAKNAVCTAINGELVGVFVLDYIPVTSVQEALVSLTRGRTQSVFAIMDFNITPLMIRQLFRMPTSNFNFPSYRERYGISTGDRPVDAVITRSGMLPLVEAAETGRKLYDTCRVSTILSLVGASVGMIILFLLCRVGSFDTASAGNVLSFMILWALPAAILSFSKR